MKNGLEPLLIALAFVSITLGLFVMAECFNALYPNTYKVVTIISLLYCSYKIVKSLRP